MEIYHIPVYLTLAGKIQLILHQPIFTNSQQLTYYFETGKTFGGKGNSAYVEDTQKHSCIW